MHASAATATAAAAVLPSSPSSSSLCITARRLNPFFQRPLAVTLIRHQQQQQMAATRASSLKDSGREPPAAHNLASLESRGFSANDREEEEEEEGPSNGAQSELDRPPIGGGKRIDGDEGKPEALTPPDENETETELLVSGETALKGTVAAGLLLVGMVGGFGTVGYIYRDQINDFLVHFSSFIDGYGNAGYALFVAVYASLEVLAIPAIPLTMSAGLLFGPVKGTILVSISGTIAATIAFLIARYLARDRILKFAEKNKKFLAIDKAIGENSFRVVTLLRLSPLLPFSLGNYLYGLTSVELVPYVLGSWLGMLPGTWAYVSAGAFGRAFIEEEVEVGLNRGSDHLFTLGLGLLFTVFAATYVTRLAKDAMKDIE